MEKTDEMTYNERNIADSRASGGRIPSFGDAPVLLLTTTGAKSVLQRTNPLMYLADEENPDRVYVFASAAGADANPGWFHNLVAHPDSVKVEIGAEATAADAEVVPEPLREASTRCRRVATPHSPPTRRRRSAGSPSSG